MTENPRPFRMPDYRLEQVDNELLLFHPAQTRILYCNETASLVWQLCDGQRNVQEIAALLAGAYPESAGSILSDVQSVLKEFQQQGAVKML